MKDDIVVEHAKRYFRLYLKQLQTLPYMKARYNYLLDMSKLYQHNGILKRRSCERDEEV